MAEAQKFFEAVRAGDAAAVRAMLQQDAALAGARDENGLSALLNARYRGRTDVVEILRAAGAPLSLWEAAAVGDVKLVSELLQRNAAQAREYSPDGFAMAHAAFFAPPEIVELLLARGADPNALSKNAMALRPLHSAAASGNSRNVELLLKAGAEVNARQHGGWTALHAAAQAGNVEMARLLLAHGADANAANDTGQTAASLAQEKGHTAMGELLRQASGRAQRAG